MQNRSSSNLIKLTACLAIAQLGMASLDSSVHAIGIGDLTKPILEGTSQLDPFKPGSKTSPINKYKIRITNSTNNRLYYNLEGKKFFYWTW